jgi:hypothetical protein
LEIGSSKVPNVKNSAGLLSSPSEKWIITPDTNKRRLNLNSIVKSPGTFGNN